MLSRAMQRSVDAVIVILRIVLEIGIPWHLLRKDALPIDHRRAFSIGSPEIEADPAAIEMPPERPRRFPRRRYFLVATRRLPRMARPYTFTPMN